MIRTFFCEKRIDPESGDVIHVPQADYAQDGLPTDTQFRYWFERDQDTLDVKRRRVGPNAPNLTPTPLLTCATPGKIHTVKSLINRQYELKHSIPNRCWMSSPGSSSTPPWSIKCACARALSPAIAT